MELLAPDESPPSPLLPIPKRPPAGRMRVESPLEDVWDAPPRFGLLIELPTPLLPLLEIEMPFRLPGSNWRIWPTACRSSKIGHNSPF